MQPNQTKVGVMQPRSALFFFVGVQGIQGIAMRPKEGLDASNKVKMLDVKDYASK